MVSGLMYRARWTTHSSFCSSSSAPAAGGKGRYELAEPGPIGAHDCPAARHGLGSTKSETVTVAAIEAGTPLLVRARDIVAAFQAMIRKRSVGDLAPWLEKARSSLVASLPMA
jgi:hypothetical protein